jgi:hypothetical protein
MVYLIFEKRPGHELPSELVGFEPKEFSWEEKIQRELNGQTFASVPPQKKITLQPHQLGAVKEIFLVCHQTLRERENDLLAFGHGWAKSAGARLPASDPG